MIRGAIRPRSSFTLATGLLLGLWGGAYVVSSPSKPTHRRKYDEVPEHARDRVSTTIPSQDRLLTLKDSKLLEPVSSRYSHALSQLTEFEQSSRPPFESGISRFDISQVMSNNPSEDDHAEIVVPVPNGHWSMFAIFDGHNGWETSAWLRENLLAAVTGSLSDLYSRIKAQTASAPEPTPDDIESTLKETFKRVDNDIVHSALERAMATSSKFEAVNILSPAHAGSCALLSFYDSHSRLLHVALTGDLRAVLGRRVNGVGDKAWAYEVHELSVDQNGHNAAEEARLSAEHPGEEIVKNGRVLGWGPSRAFGDARMKWSIDVQKHLKAHSLGRSPYANVKTPPYFTAEPEVVSIKVQPGDFLIMASDGLWESLSNEDAVGLVSWWLGSQQSLKELDVGTVGPLDLPVIRSEDFEDKTERYKQWNASKHFICANSNAATHLIRNALGGADEDLAAALLSIRSPRSRSYYDDITVTVVFFE